LYELVIKLKLKKVKLLCHSMGTLVGMEFAKLYPNLVSKLVLAGAILPKADSISTVFSEQMIKNLEYLENRQEVKNEKKYYVNNKEHLTDKEKTEYWRISFAEANIYDISKWKLLKGGQIYYNQDAYVITQSVNWNYDYRSVLSKQKATIIQGQYDFLDFNLKNYKDKLEGYKNIVLKIIPNAGHNSWIDNPIMFRKYLYEALTK
jgi:proline iminopeptidase